MIFFPNGSNQIAVRISEGIWADRYELRDISRPEPRCITVHPMHPLTRRCLRCGVTEVALAARPFGDVPCIPDL